MSVARRRVTGMVLGKDIFLTPAEIGQMRRVPEIVFVNCCHLGRITVEESTRDRHLLAANVATELIRIGVKVVVAAGWAVDDGAAALFAKTFYEQMLAGNSFGRAVHLARAAAAREFPQSNTWGAYQCYGDPAFRLRTEADAAGDASIDPFVSGAELGIVLDNLSSQALTASPDDVAAISRRIDALRDDLERRGSPWAGDARICSSFGLALGEVDRFDDAIAFFGRAATTDPASLSVKALEQYANLLSRSAVGAWKAQASPSREARQEALERIDKALNLVRGLLTIGETPERWSLLGAGHKRRALVVATAKERNQELRGMGRSYKAAHELAMRRSGSLDPYPFLNWLAAEACLHPGGVDERLRKTAAELFTRLKPAANAETAFWTLVTAADTKLVQALLTGTMSSDARDELLQAYRAVAAREGSPRQLRSIVEHLDFLAVMYAAHRGPAARALAAQIAKAADSIRPPAAPPA